MSYDQHAILEYIDAPTRFAFWTKDEVLALFIPLLIGLNFGYLAYGLVVSVLSYMATRHIKHTYGAGTIAVALYWYLPTWHWTSRFKVASHIREFIG